VKSVRTFVVGVLLCGATIVWSQPVEWKDGSPHAATLIPVDDDVQLEVLDWGGSGPAIVLLAGPAIRRTCSTILRRCSSRVTAFWG
jgi:hypothetical protein